MLQQRSGPNLVCVAIRKEYLIDWCSSVAILHGKYHKKEIVFILSNTIVSMQVNIFPQDLDM